MNYLKDMGILFCSTPVFVCLCRIFKVNDVSLVCVVSRNHLVIILSFICLPFGTHTWMFYKENMIRKFVTMGGQHDDQYYSEQKHLPTTDTQQKVALNASCFTFAQTLLHRPTTDSSAGQWPSAEAKTARHRSSSFSPPSLMIAAALTDGAPIRLRIRAESVRCLRAAAGW